ncbi:MAG: hypothetical protein E6X43_04610 [Peptostreptococcaceae bacterium]|nr:hypothetical protein [Peptostreptococcaceae bacterium]
MTSNELNDMKNDFHRYYSESSCNCASNFIKDYPALSALIASGAVISATTLFSSKARKVLFPAIKYIGKQQLKLFAGIGILSIATYMVNESVHLDDEFDNNEDDEIILNNYMK